MPCLFYFFSVGRKENCDARCQLFLKKVGQGLTNSDKKRIMSLSFVRWGTKDEFFGRTDT